MQNLRRKWKYDFCFFGTGNSRYRAGRISEALQNEVIDLNEKIKTNDNSPRQAGHDVVVVTPTYVGRVLQIVSRRLSETKPVGAERIWLVMDCGGGIGNVAKYIVCLPKKLSSMGTAQLRVSENYGVPQKAIAEKTFRKQNPILWMPLCISRSDSVFPHHEISSMIAL